MSALTKIADPMIIAEAIKEVSSLCNSIVEYRKLALQNEFTREQMHQQADLVLSERKQAHLQTMTKLDNLSKGHKDTINSIHSESDKYFQLLQDSQKSIEHLQTLIFTSKINKKNRALLLSQLANLQAERTLLINEHARNANGYLQAFEMLTDAVRNQPREFAGEFRNVN